MKKACKLHFNDVYEKMEETDNENYDLNNLNVEIDRKDEIEKIDTVEALREYARANKWKWKEFDDYILFHANKLKWKPISE